MTRRGGPPELLAVFFARTVRGGGRDLAVLCGWEHGGQVINGACYSALFYRINDTGRKIVVEAVTGLEKDFDACDSSEMNERGRWIWSSKAKFKTVSDIKKQLTKMGLKQ